jgi:hypothetical protein
VPLPVGLCMEKVPPSASTRGGDDPGAGGSKLGPALGVPNGRGDELSEVLRAVGGAGRKRPSPRRCGRHAHRRPSTQAAGDRVRRVAPQVLIDLIAVAGADGSPVPGGPAMLGAEAGGRGRRSRHSSAS